MNTHKEYSSYNGLDRTVLFMGVPLLWAVLLLVLSVATMFIGLALFDIVGILFAVVWLPVGLFLRQISQTDDKALNILMLEMRFRMKRRGYEQFGKTLTFLTDRYLRYAPTIESQLIPYNQTTKSKKRED